MTASENNNFVSRSEKPVPPAGQKNWTGESALPVREGERFLAWLRIYVMQPDRVNTKNAYVHLVNDDVFLVTPGIFKLYTKETTGSGDNDWQRAQKDFQSLGLHHRGREGGMSGPAR
ncbi:conjugal transfer nickase/helicase domain-containing protein [Enterobacter wuhouensis]|uniref:conjugal transfer nickase/helicase domain-containing protein n=1 Tax=Enterobacter wuhouensis TaxID=2529381 RepID=UPI00352475F8